MLNFTVLQGAMCYIYYCVNGDHGINNYLNSVHRKYLMWVKSNFYKIRPLTAPKDNALQENDVTHDGGFRTI